MSGAPLRVGISACLLGKPVRYDGGHKLDRLLRDTLGATVAWVPVCPEVEYGLPVPREPLLLIGDPADPLLLASRSGVDHTFGMKAWARWRLQALAGEGVCGFVFKSRSPSCAVRSAVVGPQPGGAASGAGIFARAFMDRFPLLPVEEDGLLHVPAACERFLGELLAAAHRTTRVPS